MTPTCNRCSRSLGVSGPAYLFADRCYCRNCFLLTRFATVKLIARTCSTCGRLMFVAPVSRIKHCCGPCRSAAYLGARRQ